VARLGTAAVVRRLTAAITAGMHAAKWGDGDSSVATLSFVRASTSRLEVRMLRLETPVAFDSPPLALVLGAIAHHAITITPTDQSGLDATAPRYVVDRTFPTATVESELAGPDHLQLDLPPDGAAYQLRVRHPWLRNPVLAPVATVTTSGAFKWVWLLVLVLLGDGAKIVIKRLIKRVRGTPTTPTERDDAPPEEGAGSSADESSAPAPAPRRASSRQHPAEHPPANRGDAGAERDGRPSPERAVSARK
jgi:hypothetical protein